MNNFDDCPEMILKEGFLEKESRFWKAWRKYIPAIV